MFDQNQQQQKPVMSPEEADRYMTVGKALERLRTNLDFKLVWAELTEVEPARMVGLLGSDALRVRDTQALGRVHENLQAIGIMQELVESINDRAKLAEMSQMTAEEIQEQIEAEQAGSLEDFD